MLTLVSSDGKIFLVERDIAERSVFIKNMIEDLGELSQPIPLLNVSGDILEKVLLYCEHHRGEPLPEPEVDETRRRKIEITPWDRNFIAVDQDTLFEIILAANYMDIKDLLDLGCKKVALMIQGKTTEEIREMFNIVNDFTKEEEDAIRKENEWAEAE
ncbi:hypothetical protein GYMLUDRAFT_52645 [Collybiopsis luxurians FD-317 M1]|nr:hypothetical protein GYMLUDRAFT_52645 [Collybiopsis luxurians FD-317 M1]